MSLACISRVTENAINPSPSSEIEKSNFETITASPLNVDENFCGSTHVLITFYNGENNSQSLQGENIKILLTLLVKDALIARHY